jgi:hypothetical protein
MTLVHSRQLTVIMLSPIATIQQEGTPMQTGPSSEALVRNGLHMHSRYLTRPQLPTRVSPFLGEGTSACGRYHP